MDEGTRRGTWSWGAPDPDGAQDPEAPPTEPVPAPPTAPTPNPAVDAPPTAPVRPRPGPPPPVGAPPSPPASGPRWPVVALVAALLGALAGGGVAAVVAGRDGGRAPAPAPSFGTNTSRIARPQDIQSILAKVQPGVVSIRTEAFLPGESLFDLDRVPARGAGTGTLLSLDGDVLTNAHVVAGAARIEVTLFGETEPRPADLRGVAEDADLAVVRLRDTDGLAGRPVELGSSDAAQVGDAVLAIGNALALPGGPTVTEGIISAKDRSIAASGIRLSGLLQTDAAINQGNSGGPLVNADGEVIGINTVVIRSTGTAEVQNIGFAIPVDAVKPMLDDLSSGAPAGPQGFLGVTTATLTPEIRERFSLIPDKGAIIIEVAPGSPAAEAGLQSSDIVTAVDGRGVATNADLTDAIRSRSPGDEVAIDYVRGGEARTATVVLGTRPPGP